MFNKSVKIRTRAFMNLFGLMLLAIGMMFLVFNVSLNIYMRTISEEQLKHMEIVKNRINSDSTRAEIAEEVEIAINEYEPKINNIRLNMAFFVIDSNYNIIENKDVIKANLIVNEIKEDMNLEEIKYKQVKTEENFYYITAIHLEEYDEATNVYMCFYADITNMTNFTNMTNIILLVISGIVLIFTIPINVAICKKMTDPVKALIRTATKIEEGDFANAQIKEKFKETELQELVATMNKATRQLDLYDQDQKTFFSNASHELRTPLMPIKCCAEGLQYGIMDKDKAIETIINEVDRASEIIEDILYISRLDNITKPYDKSKYDLRELLSTAASKQKQKVESKGIAFEFNFCKEEIEFTCNAKLMEVVFVHFISNATRFAREKIILSCGKEQGMVKVSVQDDGEGIDENDLPHLFERFYKGKKGNHGMGLSIVKTIVEQHGGSVYAANTDKGAKFTIEFKI